MSTVDNDAWHYIRSNDSTRIPRRHVFLDTEAREDRHGKERTQSWRCGVAIMRDGRKDRVPQERINVYDRPGPLWRDVDKFCGKKGRVVLWSHNLGYDARISAMFDHLPRAGWELVGWNMAPQGAWLIWRHGSRTLTMVDSASVFPTRLAQIAKSFDDVKQPLPSNVDSYDTWVARCLKDAQILRNAIVAYLGWVESEDLGTWQITGTGQAWTALRHRFLSHRLLVHWDDEARAAERRAMWTGRTEAYWHGTIRRGRVDEWDMTQAYPRIAARHDVPTALVKTLGPGADVWTWMDRPGYAVLAEVSVVTADPLVPAERDGYILWPIGSFETTLWDPELRLLRERGATVVVHRAWLYDARPALQDWADWIGSIVDDTTGRATAWQQLIAKHWGRAVVGRAAMRHQTWERVATHVRSGCTWRTMVDRDTGEVSDLVHIGRSLWQSTGEVDWAHSVPQITGWIMSKCREILTRVLLLTGQRVALYADTDSLLVEHRHHDRVAELAAQHPHWGLRLKRSWRDATIYGPRQIVTGGRVRVSGVPVTAEPMPDGALEGEVWESLRGAIRQGRPTAVKIISRRWRLSGVERRRIVGPDGWTEPIEIGA